jgi:protocatechuate 3,4-dioxygenase beta subunit
MATTSEATFAISGTVLDMSGAVVPGAQIQVAQVGSEKKSTIRSNETGGFRLDSLARGSYRIEIIAPGFSTFKKQVFLWADREFRFQATLEVGSMGGPIMVEPVASPIRYNL